jgi:hypothetical protein
MKARASTSSDDANTAWWMMSIGDEIGAASAGRDAVLAAKLLGG